MSKTKTIILLVILIAIGGIVLFGEKNRYITPKAIPPLKNLIQLEK